MVNIARHRIANRLKQPVLAGFLGLLAIALILASAPDAEAKSRGLARIAVDAHTGEILYASRSQVRWHPASLTKMMTLYQLFSALQRGKVSLDTKIKFSPRAARQPPSKLGIRAGGYIRVRDAIDALAVKSANDVAVAVAEKLSGSEVAFAKRMNKTARYLGMSRTNFRNASGLHHSKQVTTARDMAILSVALMRDFPQYYNHFGKKSFTYGKRHYGTHNRILKNYRGADGIKTGYIAKSGFNLAASAVRDNERIVAVVLGAKSSSHRATLMTRLLDTGFKEMKKSSRRRIARPLPVRLQAPPPVPRPRPGYKPPRIVTPDRNFKPEYAPLPRPEPRQVRGVAAVAAKAPQPAAAIAADGAFAIQVGAFRSKDQAKQQLSQVVARLPSSHAEAEPAIVSIRGRSSRVLYRARLTGYEERDDASAACDWLKARKTDCMVVLLTNS
jgi:D-alanyl-D-alanine carboxypeptidase